MNEKTQPFTVKMLNATGLSAAERSAGELRFRMALEVDAGGYDPALNCYFFHSCLRPLLLRQSHV